MIEFRSECTAELLDVFGDEELIARRARVSTDRQDGVAASTGLIRSLVRERHGVPFEHATMAWSVAAPIFVFRELVRHRIMSMSEMSGRYIELPGIFWVPPADRHLVKTEGTKQMAYSTQPGDWQQQVLVQDQFKNLATAAWASYQLMLSRGILKEIARGVLPVTIYSKAHITMNVRALTNFLSLRVRSANSHIESKPMREIQELAEQMEADFALHFPNVHAQFVASGRLPL